MSNTVAVADLFKFLLKNSLAHQEKFEDDVFNDYLPATLLNRRMLANNSKKLFADNPDLDVDHIDRVYDRPLDDVEGMTDDEYLKYQQDYVKGAIDAQISNPELAKQMKRNIDKRIGYYDNIAQDVKRLNKNNTKVAEAWDNYDKLRLDRMLSNLLKRSDLPDADKISAALRLIYNNATRKFQASPVDMKLDQDDLYESMPLDAVDAYNKVEPNYLEKERVLSDTMPITYMSDKTIDEEGREYSIFTPSKETNIIYDMFADKFLKDLANGEAPDTDELSSYILSLYSDRLRTMPFDEWQKTLDKEAEELNKRKAEQLGRELKESEKVELDVPEDALTPEDWAGQMNPDKYKVGKSAAEKADNKLNRWHSKNKDAYKAYLEDVASTRQEGSSYDDEMDITIEGILHYIKQRGPKLKDEIEYEEAMGHTDKVIELRATANMYKDILSGSDSGIAELNNWAHRVVSNSHREMYDLQDRKESASKAKRDAVMKEFEQLSNEQSNLGWTNDFLDRVNSRLGHAKQLAAEQDNIAQKEYKGMSGKDLKKAMLGKYYTED